MTVAVSHWTRSPGASVSLSSHPTDYSDMAYSEVQFSVDSMDEDKDGSGGQSHLPWGEVTERMGGGGPGSGAAPNDTLLFEEFVDLERLSTAGGDEIHPPALPDSFFFNIPLPAHGSASTTSASDDLDDLLSCHSQPLVEARTSAAAGPAATVVPSSAAARVAAATADAVVPPAVGVPGPQSSWSIDRREGQRKASTYPDTAHAGGSESISDSELLRLEGISLKASPSRAPSVVVSHPPTPLPQPSSATSSNTNLHVAGSSNQNNPSSSSSNHTNNGGRKPSNFFKVVASKLQQKAASVRHKQPNMSSVALDSRGPLSPNVSPRKAFKLRPSSSALAAPPGSNGMPFCGGYVEDPFFDAGVAGGHVPMFRRSDPTTPMDTPVLDDKGGMFYHHQQMSSGNVANTSKATWPMATTTPQTDSHVAWSNAYATDSLDNQWWDGGHMDLSSNSQFQAQNARNATFNLAMHTQHSELPYEYNNIAAGHEMSGLMIHMPQPRTTSSPVIHYQPQQQQQLHHQQHPQQMTERRPRMPRAPSAGTRHMCLSTPMRKTRNPSRTRQPSRDSSTSPTPTNRSRHSSGGSLSSIGARRSWSRRESLRTPSIGSGLGGAPEGVGFVNFTPSDKNILMTGVAPSGSSKTKARREKEAMEKRRRLSEAAIKAVKAAGGDVDKLVEEGFVF
ncbi:developmental regulatory protein wetA [Colletotrichum liriopes]|uniref:Developmental regulatory protein wetA n=1 Tax=Colletotrichum liriopes TaxID=708192 RepID=A0AA37GER2_9PEZI|nr:developmental regulatory protein wetA [Colletotrichum liriopes]